MPTEADLRLQLSRVSDPVSGGSIVETGRASGFTARGDTLGFVLDLSELTAAQSEALKRSCAEAAPGARIITTAQGKGEDAGAAKTQAAPRQPHEKPAPNLSRLGQIIAVASGKGGVGKSTIAANLAVALAAKGKRTGLLDADIYGPSVPTLLGAAERAGGEQGRIEPLERHGLKLLSIANLTPPGQAVVWRGPMAAAAMMQMITEGDWGDLDVLIIDMPPGTGDLQLSLAQKVRPAGAVIVSTPQDLALIDAQKGIAMFQKVDVPILGIVENMSMFHCDVCGTDHPIFGNGGARDTARQMGVPFLGSVPLTMALREASDAGTPAVTGTGPAADALNSVADELTRTLERIEHAADAG